MAYADNRRIAASPASIGAALAINGLLVAGIALSVPDIVPPPIWKVLETYTVTRPAVPVPAQPRPKAKGKESLLPRIPPENPVDTKEAENIPALTTDEVRVGGSGGIEIETPPLKIDPVIKPARIDPHYAGALQPVYPPGMIREEREGLVTVRVLVGTDGRVRALEAVRADAPAFLEATRKQALSKWRFLPATRDGSPIESWREMTVRFELPD